MIGTNIISVNEIISDIPIKIQEELEQRSISCVGFEIDEAIQYMEKFSLASAISLWTKVYGIY